MNETEKNSSHQKEDALMASRFAEMRAAESTTSPALTRDAPTHATQIEPRPARNYSQILPRAAAAVALVAVTATLLLYQTTEDPALLYTNIMNKQQMQTDSLLIVSDSVLPAMSTLPNLYEIDLEFESDTYSN